MNIAATGDTLCRVRGGGKDPFTYVRPVWERADVRFVNLEAVLSRRGCPAQKRTLLRTAPESAKWLRGIEAANIANNHIFDYGATGCLDTMRNLRLRGVVPVGVTVGEGSIQAPTGVVGGGVGFLGFHAYSLRAGPYAADHLEDWDRVLRTVRGAANDVDSLVVSLHWGAEHAPHPSPGQIGQARALVDAGAALVVGHGPHRLQSVERYGGGLIAYSLGNFNFWHTDVRERWFNRLSAVLLAELDGAGVAHFRLAPCAINGEGKPVPLEGPARLAALSHVGSLSRPDITWDEWYEEVGPRYVRDSLGSFAETIPKHGWVRVRKLFWWLRQAHTRRAIAGLLRRWTKNLS